MAILDPNEPLGLPPGSVRSVIALAFTVVSLYLFATGQPVPDALLAVNTLIVGNYFGSRGSIPVGPDGDEEIAAPYIPGEDAGK